MSDSWDFYFCQVDDHPASIFVDLGIHDDVPVADLSDMAWLRLYMRRPREDGLYGKEEYDRLIEIEDALTGALPNAETEIAYVGRNTSNGCRDFYFYAANGTQAENCLSMAMVPFPEYEFDVGSRTDADWTIYREFLYPTPRAYQTILNHRVLTSLEKSGDHHDIEREVTHWIYFQSADDRDRYLNAAIQKGYKVVALDEDAEREERQFGLRVSRSHAVDFRTIDDAVLELFDLAGECGGDYDGWETSVEKGKSLR